MTTLECLITTVAFADREHIKIGCLLVDSETFDQLVSELGAKIVWRGEGIELFFKKREFLVLKDIK